MQTAYRHQTVLTWVVSICILHVATSCTSHKTAAKPIELPAVESLVEKQTRALGNFSKSTTISPGMASLIDFPYFGPFLHESLLCNGDAIPFFKLGSGLHAYAFISVFHLATKSELTCVFSFAQDDGKRTAHEIHRFQITAAAFPKEGVHVDEKVVTLSKKDQARVERETALLNDVFQKGSTTVLFDSPFVTPLSSKITSAFGTARTFNKKHKNYHLGTDFRAGMGTKIRVANAGRVCSVGNFFYGGNMVIVDHGVGVFTAYAHLSKILVKEGEMIKQNTVVGLSGRSGRANGPHLHWGVKVQGNWVDGQSLIEQSQVLIK